MLRGARGVQGSNFEGRLDFSDSFFSRADSLGATKQFSSWGYLPSLHTTSSMYLIAFLSCVCKIRTLTWVYVRVVSLGEGASTSTLDFSLLS